MRPTQTRDATRNGLTGFILLAAAACGGDDQGPEPGEELGRCIDGFCQGGLICTDELCVSPEQVDTDGGGEDPSGDAGGTTSGATTSGTVTSGTSTAGTTTSAPDDTAATAGEDIHCSVEGDDFCACGHSADWGPAGASCSPAEVGNPAVCCGSTDWPGSGTCTCWHVSCRILSPFNDTCTCNIGGVDPEDTAVDTCTSDEGVCCREDDACSCHDDLTECLSGEPVSSCSTSDVGCGGGPQLAQCN